MSNVLNHSLPFTNLVAVEYEMDGRFNDLRQEVAYARHLD